MQEYSGSDMQAASGTLSEIRDWLITNHHTPLAIHALWLDPISDQLHLRVEVDPNENSKSFIDDFNIIPAEGAVFSPFNWQPLGDPLPLIPYEDREIVSVIALRPFPAPAYYQPVVRHVQQRSTHLSGMLRWHDANEKHPKKKQIHHAIRLIHDSLIMPTIAKIKESRHQPNLDFHYNLIRVACRAPPWHPQAGYFLVSPLPRSPKSPRHSPKSPRTHGK